MSGDTPSGIWRRRAASARPRAIADTLVISYPYLMQLAGYMDETAPDEAPATEDVFRDESTGRLVDVSSGAREMLQNDAAWANVAYRVSRELSEEDRQMLTVLAMQYLKKNQGDGPWNR